MKKILTIIIFALTGTATHTATAQTYDPYAVQVINNLIANNGLQATPDAPETWLFTAWNDETPKQITLLLLSETKLTGNVLCSGLTKLQKLWVEKTSITKLNVSGCSQLEKLTCTNNKLTELNLTGCFELKELYCDDNYFTQLDVSNCIKLKFLVCNSNYLTEIDISNCSQLGYLSCSNNNLRIIDVDNCTQMTTLICEVNNLTKLDLTNCAQLYHLECSNNKLNELYIVNCTQLSTLMCNKNCLTKIDLPELENPLTFLADEQSVSLILYENEDGEYTLPISLNNPSFGNSAISYSDGMLKSNDKTVTSTSFRVTTGEYYNRLNGTMYFNYSNIGVNEIDCEGLRVYPNPATGELIINNYELRIINVEIYDVNGRKQKAESRKQNSEGEMVVDISHLPAGVYLVKVFTEQGEITKKIVKQ